MQVSRVISIKKLQPFYNKAKHVDESAIQLNFQLPCLFMPAIENPFYPFRQLAKVQTFMCLHTCFRPLNTVCIIALHYSQ